MRRTSLALAVSAALALASSPLAGDDAPKAPRVTARVDPAVELLSIVFRLAGNPEYSQGKVDAYTKAVEAQFGKLRDHAVVRHAASLRQRRGVSFDAVMGLAVHLDDRFRPAEPLAKAEGLDKRWPADELDAFVKELGAFAAAGRAPAFFEAQRPLYEKAEKRLQKVLDENVRFAWFEQFFGARPKARFVLEIGLLNGGANYGPHVRRADGTEELHCVLGAWKTDAAGDPQFDAGDVVSTIVHEFCHSYCNAIADAHEPELGPACQSLWPEVADEMARQAYGDWRTMMRESLVRACVVRYQAAAGGPDAAKREADEQVGRSFLWTGELAAALAEYEADRRTFPTLDAFMPRLAKVLGDFAAARAQAHANEPKVLRLEPANLASDVDPALAAIVITFDREMADGCWAVVGGGPHYPKFAGRPHYDDAHRVLTVPVELQPDWSYEFWLNRGKFDSFQSADGVKLRSVHVTFTTRSK
jgi:uncharacterized protein DUF4932